MKTTQNGFIAKLQLTTSAADKNVRTWRTSNRLNIENLYIFFIYGVLHDALTALLMFFVLYAGPVNGEAASLSQSRQHPASVELAQQHGNHSNDTVNSDNQEVSTSLCFKQDPV